MIFAVSLFVVMTIHGKDLFMKHTPLLKPTIITYQEKNYYHLL